MLDSHGCPIVEQIYPGVGDHLTEILHSIGIVDDGGCGCEQMAAKMNNWGPSGCRARRQEIIDHLRSKAKERGWMAQGWAALLAVRNVATWLNPLDPFGSLVDEACRRAESTETPP